jgi:hypothetical protein
MLRKTTGPEAVATIGIDIGKNTFHLIGLEEGTEERLPRKAIAEAVLRPTMKFVAIKTVEQLDLQGLHRLRDATRRQSPL